jgi:O-antigen ligase
MKYYLVFLFFVLMVSDTMGYPMSYVPGFSVKNLLLYGLIIVVFLRTKNAGFPSGIGSLNIFYILLLIIAIVSWILSSIAVTKINYNSYKSFLTLKILVDQYLFFMVYLFALNDRKDILWCVKAVICIVILGNIITIIDVFNIPDLGIIHERPDGRVGGPLGESNQYAAFMVFFIPTLIGMATFFKGLIRYFFIAGTLGSVLVWILTVSRGSMVGIILSFCFGIIILKNYLNLKMFAKQIFLLTPIVSIPIIVAIYQYYDLFYDRIFVKTGQAENMSIMSSGRVGIWSNALEKLFDNPLNVFLGMGWNTFKQYFAYAPHNIYLNYLFELGIIGLLLVLIIFFKIFKISYKNLKNADSIELIVLVSFIFGYIALLISVFFVDLYKPWIFIWSYMGLVMRLALEISCENNQHNL